MAANLKEVNAREFHPLSVTQFHTKLTQTIIALYVCIVIVVAIGTWFSLYQTWILRIEDTKANLTRSANIGNYLIETALTSAAKSLDSTQISFERALQSGALSQQLAGELLNTSYARFKEYNKADRFGLIFFVDKNGKLYARSGQALDEEIDFSDRFYFYQLKNHPEMRRAVGPLVLARTTGEWVFHMSVPVHDPEGHFFGVLVQQILEKDIASNLAQYANISSFDRMVTLFKDKEPSFIFLSPGASELQSKGTNLPLPAQADSAYRNGGVFAWYTHQTGSSESVLTGVAKSPLYNFETYVTLPVGKVKQAFLIGNTYLLLYVVVGMLLVTSVFYYLYKLSRQLASAQVESWHDPLTKIHNRRALDAVLPGLLREAMRSQEPISVLFIDIDHFRYFNETYGHESGDIALKAVAHALAACARRPLDFVCRWGGEEFVIVLPNTSRSGAAAIAHDVLTTVRTIELRSADGQCPKITVSVGHVTADLGNDAALENLVDRADKAMLKAKSQGRNQSVEYAANL